MPPWMNTESILLDYTLALDLSAFTVVQKNDGLYVDGTLYGWDTTITALRTALSLGGSGDYDDCVIDLIEEVDGSGNVWIETNTNFILLDSFCEALVDFILYKQQAIREMNPLLATADFGLPYWEAMFASKRQSILGVLETDGQYMVRVISELFATTTSLLNIQSLLEELGLQPFTLINTRKDPFQFNKKMWPYSVNLHLDGADENKIQTIRQIFSGASAAGTRLILMCNVFDQGYGYSYGANYGGWDGTSDYLPVPEFITDGVVNLIGYGAGYGSYYPG